MTTWIIVGSLMLTPATGNKVDVVKAAPKTRTTARVPPLAGITPPTGTKLANMDIVVKSRPHGEPAVYELESSRSATSFRDQYVLNARRAGYKVSINGLLVLGVRKDGTSIRLRVIQSGSGSRSVLTVKAPTNDHV